MRIDRQNVRKAPHLFSNTIGNFILQYMPSEIQAANFILLIDKVFDIFNSSKEIDGNKHFKSSFSGGFEQISLLKTAYNEIKNI